jgi:hypothetical protein
MVSLLNFALKLQLPLIAKIVIQTATLTKMIGFNANVAVAQKKLLSGTQEDEISNEVTAGYLTFLIKTKMVCLLCLNSTILLEKQTPTSIT